jgi:hypothetical protein
MCSIWFGWFCRFEIRRCKMSQACSIGYRSGDFAGQSMRSIVSCWRYSLTILANCRHQFARRHANWCVRRIRPVPLTDESRFCLDFHDGRRRVFRQKNERFKNCCVVEHVHQRVHLLALVGSLAGFVDLKSDVARCPKHVLSYTGPETLLASPCARLF